MGDMVHAGDAIDWIAKCGSKEHLDAARSASLQREGLCPSLSDLYV